MSTVGVVNVGKHGAAESIMMLLHVGGKKLGKLKNSVEEWLKEKQIEGVFDYQNAVAVGRCIGAAAGLISGDHWLDAQLDTLGFLVYEMLQKSEAWYKTADKEERAALRNELLAEISQYYLHRFETAVKNNEGHYFSSKLSWLDIFFFGALEVLEMYFGVGLIDGKFPYLLKLIEEVGKIPAIREYIANRRNKALVPT